MESCFEDLRSKTFQWEKKGFLSKKRTKNGPVIELLRTFSCYFRNNAKRSLKARVYDKSAYVHCGRTVVYYTYDPISQPGEE